MNRKQERKQKKVCDLSSVACIGGLLLSIYTSSPVFGTEGQAICAEPPQQIFDNYKRFRYRVRTDFVIAVPYRKIIQKDTGVHWCLRTENENLSVPDDNISVRLPMSMDQARPEYSWGTNNNIPWLSVSLLEAGYMQTGPIAFLREILESGSSFFTALHFDLKYWIRRADRLFLITEASFGTYEPKPNNAVTSFRDIYGALLFDYRLHTYKRVELHWVLGAGLTYENYILNGQSVENYTSQIKTGGVLRLNILASITAGCFIFFRFNPDRFVNDSRLIYGLSMGVKF